MAGESAREVARRSREKAERLISYADKFERGADGEVITAAVLATLDVGWTTLHDVRWPGRRFANIDHIVVGPGGIFVVDSKNWSGKVTFEKGVVRQNGRSRETAVSGCADSALAVAELAGPYASAVIPVLCFVRDEPLTGWTRDVMICSTKNLNQMLCGRPILFNPDQVADAAMRLDVEVRNAASAVGPTKRLTKRQRSGPSRTPKSRTAPRSKSRSRSRSKTPSLGGLVAGIAMIVGVLAFGPQLSTAISELLSNQLVPTVEKDQTCPQPTKVPGKNAHSKADAQQSC